MRPVPRRLRRATIILLTAAHVAFASGLYAQNASRAAAQPATNPIADGGNSAGYDMAPETRLEVVFPRADGTIPDEQQQTLLEVGRWLRVNGEAIYRTHNWTTLGEGYARGSSGPNVRFTVKGPTLYAIVLGDRPAGGDITIKSLGTSADGAGKVEAVELLGGSDPVEFAQDGSGLHVKLPAGATIRHAATLKISGLQTNPAVNPPDGNPR